MNNLKLLDFKSIRLSLSKWIRRHQIDILITTALAIPIAIATWIGTYQIPDPIFTDFYAQDVWFGSDIPTVFGNITSINSDFGRNNKHPLFPLLIFPLVFGLGKFLQLDPLAAVRVLIVIVAVVWIAALYILLRLMGCYRLDATLFSLLGGVSAASVFWLVIPESFSFGSVTILFGLIFVVLTQYHGFSPIWYVGVNLLTVSITITNAMVGIFATVVNHRWKKVLQIGVVTLLLATGLWILQRIVFTNSGFPFQPGTFIGEKKFMSAPAHGGILAAVSSFLYQTMVMPTIKLVDSSGRPDWVTLDVNPLNPMSGGIGGAIAVVSWTLLLGLGLWGFFSTQRLPKLRIVLGLTLVAQLFMHSIYGVEETFIYSLHFIPLLLTLVAFSLFTRLRLLSLSLAIILLISVGINNRTQFNDVASALWNYGTPQQQVEAQMKLRPSDPWQRSAGHVLLATPGSAVEGKAFHEPGGSFSPVPGSFGISIWMVDQQGNLKATSDSIPLSDIQQQFTNGSAQKIPGISTKTPFYESSWTAVKPGIWQLNLKTAANSDTRPVVVIRSVGPAGGAIRSLDWDGQRLLISDRWTVRAIPRTARVYLGSESTPNWTGEQSTRSHWDDHYGWGYARIAFNQGNTWSLTIEDNQPISDSNPPAFNVSSNLALNLPDAQFVDSLTAQVSHLTMGLVGNRTHPTDPISYPLPRFRDGAYQMVALARAGQLDIARQLSTYFAENDFFNDAVPAADIPALGIWALEQVASQLNQPEYDQWLWPHVRRKADLIGTMLSSNRPGYPVFSGARVPFSEYPDFLRVDLVAGKMKHRPGSISLDASASVMSYRALLDAAALADRLKQPQEARRWRTQAEAIKTAWQEANRTGFSSLTNGLWPTWIAASEQAAMTQALQQRWDESRDSTGAFQGDPQALPDAIAEAHQWLLLKQPERVWATLKWFWANQDSPGLYTWGIDQNQLSEMPLAQSFSQWHRFRGWMKSSYATPHYWTAAEMALLQLDMLAYIDQSASTPTLVIGAGIPEEWLKQPIGVKGLVVGNNLINWAWDGNRIKVEIQGKKMNVQAGSAFPGQTPVDVLMLKESTLAS